MIRLLKKIFRPGQKPASPAQTGNAHRNIPVLDENGQPEDPVLTAIINEAWRSGEPVIAEFDERGQRLK